MTPTVGIIMGSASDLSVMQEAVTFLKDQNVPYEVKIVSAHRTPEEMIGYAKMARKRGLQVIIAGAGGAAHLPGMVAAVTTLPVIGVPIRSTNSIDGWDSILSILQMPNGVPVATVALNASKNAAILALQILSLQNPAYTAQLDSFKNAMKETVAQANEKLEMGKAPA